MPLVRSWWLSKKKGQEAYIVPTVVGDTAHPSSSRVKFEIGHDKAGAPNPDNDGTMSGRHGARCIACKSVIGKDYIKTEAIAGRMGSVMMAVVSSYQRRRVHLPPTDEQVSAAAVDRPTEIPDGELSTNSQYMGAPLYGMTTTGSLFTNRQLVAMTTFCNLVMEVRDRILADGAVQEYADAVTTYLGLCASKMTVFHCSLARWRPDADKTAPAFGRQAIAMVWDFAECMPFSGAGGDWSGVVDGGAKTLEGLHPASAAKVLQVSATNTEFPPGVVLSTDPPYYDNVPYADLSDFFYVWLRRMLRKVYPDILSTVLVPKADELVANPSRQGGRDCAKRFFEDGFRSVFARARSTATGEYPVTVYYAFRQAEVDDDGQASSGWETLLEGMIRSGWAITATWPMRTEGATRMRASESNALASSIVLSLRPRPDGAPTTDRRGFIATLEAELPDALRKLQQGQIAPVDLPQATIGPGMEVFSRYGAVLEPNGSKMTVRSALARINEILDQVLNEQEGDFDATSRFAIAWYRQHGYGVGKFGDADNLARARNTSVDVMDRDGILTSRAGSVQLIKPADLSWDYDAVADLHTSNWEALHHLIKVLERDGIAPAGGFLQAALSRPDGAVDADLIKELAHLLFRISEGNGWVKDALSFNNLVTSWPEILDVAHAEKKQPTTAQGAFDFEDDE
jgi:putative DNA methylase